MEETTKKVYEEVDPAFRNENSKRLIGKRVILDTSFNPDPSLIDDSVFHNSDEMPASDGEQSSTDEDIEKLCEELDKRSEEEKIFKGELIEDDNDVEEKFKKMLIEPEPKKAENLEQILNKADTFKVQDVEDLCDGKTSEIKPIIPRLDSYDCAVCQIRRSNGFCDFYGANKHHGIICNGKFAKRRKEVLPRIIDVDLVCVETRGDYRTCRLSHEDVLRLLDGDALMIGNCAVIFEEGNKE